MCKVLSGKIKYIEAPDTGRTAYANSLLIDDEIKALLDTNCGSSNIEFFQEQAVDVIINSHFHEDHVWNNYKFPQAEIWAHSQDAEAIQSLDVFTDNYGLLKYNEKELWDYYMNIIEVHPTAVDRKFEDREILDFGSTQIQVIHTPGHTPGHCCFLIADSMLFSTDFALNAFGPWYGHLCSNVTDLIESINLCIEIKPSMIIPSHRAIITENIPQKLQDYRNVLYVREEKILKSLQNPATLEELRDLYICYGRYWKDFPPRPAFEKFYVLAHLERLLSLGEIKQNGNIYYLK